MATTDLESVLTLLAQAPHDALAAHPRLPSDRTVAADVTALANGAGGFLLIGATESGSVPGLSSEDADLALDRLARICESVLPARAIPERAMVQGHVVVLVSVPSADSALRPLMTADGRTFERRQGHTVAIAPERSRGTSVTLGGSPSHRDGARVRTFVAMSFRDEQEPALVDYFQAMVRAAKTVEGIDLRRMDAQEGDYEISEALMDEIRAADLVIADFTLSPANVYFEAGFARGCGKFVIQTARKGTALEFDVRNWRTLVYRNAHELEAKLSCALAHARDQIRQTADSRDTADERPVKL